MLTSCRMYTGVACFAFATAFVFYGIFRKYDADGKSPPATLFRVPDDSLTRSAEEKMYDLDRDLPAIDHSGHEVAQEKQIDDDRSVR